VRRLITSIIAVVFLLSFPLAAFANSGPVFWQGYPSSDVMSVDEHSPIAVENETLVFDFADGDNSHYSIRGRVNAAYKMRNPTNEMQSVQMAFPFVGSLDSLKAEDIVIATDGSVLPYEVYLGDVVNSYGDPLQEDNNTSFDFERIVSTLTNKAYQAESIGGKKTGKLYLIEVIPLNNQRINCAIDFTFDKEKTKVLTNGFNRYERNDQQTKIAAWCYEPELLEIFVLGEDINLEVNGFLDGSLEGKTDLFTYRISTQEIELKPYLMERIQKHITSVQDSEILDI